MNRCFALMMALVPFLSPLPIDAEEIVHEFVIFKVKTPSKGIEIARSLIKDIKSFNDGVIEDVVYQSINDPTVIAQCITWKSLEKAKEAFAAFNTFPSAATFSDQSGEIIFFDHFKKIKTE